MTDGSCPSRDKLFAYLVGRLLDADSEIVAQHVEVCSVCEEILVEIDDRMDPFVAQLSDRTGGNDIVDESECLQAIVQAERAVAPTEIGIGNTESRVTSFPLLGHRLGEYEILDKLGQGGMGAVYKAWHSKLRKPVALKVLAVKRLGDAEALLRFEREMAAVGSVDHPNIVRALDAREIDGTHFLVMEYVEGISLSELIRQSSPLDISSACEMVRQASVGLQHVHELGLVHRDIKPSNLMLAHSGQVKILDLGLARIGKHQISGEQLTSLHQVMGTPDYIAPEQTTDSHSVDIRADIYSLGCTLYELLVGQPPYCAPRYSSAFEKMVAHVRDVFPNAKQFRQDASDELLAVVNRMTDKSPARRFAEPKAVAEGMVQFTTGADVSRRLLTLAQRGQTAANRQEALGSTMSHAGSADLVTQLTTVTECPETVDDVARRRGRWTEHRCAIALTSFAAIALIVLGISIFIRFQLKIEVDENKGVNSRQTPSVKRLVPKQAAPKQDSRAEPAPITPVRPSADPEPSIPESAPMTDPASEIVDSFEAGLLPHWLEFRPNRLGTLYEITSAYARSGTQAVMMAQSRGEDELSLHYEFRDGFQGTLAIWQYFPEQPYEQGAGTHLDGDLYRHFKQGASGDGAHTRFYVLDAIERRYSVEQEHVLSTGGTVGVQAETGPRSLGEGRVGKFNGGWHEIRIEVSDRGARGWYDGQPIPIDHPNLTSCFTVGFGIGWNCTGIVIWDDFSVTSLHSDAMSVPRNTPTP